MLEHALTFDIVVSEESGACEWTLFMSGLLVGKGQVNNPDELFTARFYENELKSVKASRYYQNKYCQCSPEKTSANERSSPLDSSLLEFDF